MNRGSDSILSVYSDARAEYTKQLCVFLVPAYFQFFIELLEKAKQDMINEPKRSLWQFQTYLNEIHDWNMQKVQNEIQRINTNSGCDYLEDLLTAVFIAHTKVLTAIRLSANKKKIEISVPKVEHFLFKVLCETSKLLWSSTYLFRDGISGIEKQQNYRNIEHIINEGILQAVRSLVPVKSILRDFVSNDADDADNDDSDEEKDDMKEPSKIDIPEQIPMPETTPEIPFTPDITLVEKVLFNQTSQNEVTDSAIKNEIIQPTEPIEPIEPIEPTEPTEIIQTAPTIVIDDRPTVRFGEYNTVFDSENPYNSDLVYEEKDEDEDHIPALEILDEEGTSLSEGLDFEDLNEIDSKLESLGEADYEDLN